MIILPPAPPSRPHPPTAKLTATLPPPCSAVDAPPLPPPPPILWAKMAEFNSPPVYNLPELLMVTAPPFAPAPAKPPKFIPTLTVLDFWASLASCSFSDSALGLVADFLSSALSTVLEEALPASPPPPPMLWAKMAWPLFATIWLVFSALI